MVYFFPAIFKTRVNTNETKRSWNIMVILNRDDKTTYCIFPRVGYKDGRLYYGQDSIDDKHYSDTCTECKPTIGSHLYDHDKECGHCNYLIQTWELATKEMYYYIYEISNDYFLNKLYIREPINLEEYKEYVPWPGQCLSLLNSKAIETFNTEKSVLWSFYDDATDFITSNGFPPYNMGYLGTYNKLVYINTSTGSDSDRYDSERELDNIITKSKKQKQKVEIQGLLWKT